ncbi:ribonuclease H-like domain-containing protein [Tanacetum coccineum]
MLYEYGLLVVRPVDIPLPENSVFYFEESENDKYLNDFTSYQKLVGKLIYLTNTRPDISYAVHCLSQHMHSPLQSHFKATLRVLRYLKRKSVTGFCVFLGQSLVSWKSTKHDTLSKSSSEAKFKRVSSASCEIIWLGNLLHSLGLKSLYHVDLCCDNSSSIQIVANPVFHERTKHSELNVYFVKKKVMVGIIKTVKVDTKVQVADIFTKCLGVVHHSLFCRKLRLLDMFTGIMTGKEKGRIQSKKKVQTEGG